jgi:hypothetical protein
MLRKLKDISYAQLKIVKNNTGNFSFFFIFRAEGSLNQHVKLKHPEYSKEKGLLS